MLVLTRKIGQSIVIGDNITIKIVSTDGDQVKIGIEAPRHVEIHRQEVYEAIQEENRLASAKQSISIEQLKQLSNKAGGMKIGKKNN